MEKAEAVDILGKFGFQEENPISTVNLARISKDERLARIRQTNVSEEQKEAKTHCAAIEITRTWRGYWCRKHLKTLFKTNDTNVSKEDPAPKVPDTEPVQPEISLVTAPSDSPKVSPKSSAIQRKQHSSEYFDTVGTTETGPTPTDISQEVAQVISDASTSQVQQKSYSSGETPEVEKVPDQARVVPKPRKIAAAPFSRIQAATVIQKAWRRHIDMQVFRYYRDLINFRRQGNPSLMLRCINPAEAKLLDAATGTHIKFRLAGEKFPPNIYYKIYTHRPVVDMCANSPKDYTKAEAKQATAKQVHTKNVPGPESSEKDGWYMRVENNGWRLVSDRLIHAAMDPTTWETSKKKVEFHHDKLIRKADLDKRRRQKKIAWMHKMYKQGMLQVKVEDLETSELVKKAADGLINTVDSHGPDGVMDWEVDELLQWTTALNFDDYLEGWKETATSNISEFEVEELLMEKSSKLNAVYEMPYETYPADQTAPYNTSIQMPQAVKNP